MDTFQQQLTRIPARVCRDGLIETVSANELAPGAIVLLSAGDIVPADCRLLDCTRLRVQEGVLTGESGAVEKTTDPQCLDDLPVWERHNIAFCGTWVTDGSGLGLVTAIGEDTAYGQIVTLTQAVQRGRHRSQQSHTDTTQIVMVFLLIVLAVLVVVGLLLVFGQIS